MRPLPKGALRTCDEGPLADRGRLFLKGISTPPLPSARAYLTGLAKALSHTGNLFRLRSSVSHLFRQTPFEKLSIATKRNLQTQDHRRIFVRSRSIRADGLPVKGSISVLATPRLAELHVALPSFLLPDEVVRASEGVPARQRLV